MNTINKAEIDEIINNIELYVFLLNESFDKLKFKLKIKIEQQINFDVKFILEPYDMPDFGDVDILKSYVLKDINANIDFFDDIKSTYKISDPYKAEWILHKSISNSKLVGNGNNNIDIIVNNIGIDVSVLTLNNSLSNEKSIMQNFTNSNNLDQLFIEKKGDEIVSIF